MAARWETFYSLHRLSFHPSGLMFYIPCPFLHPHFCQSYNKDNPSMKRGKHKVPSGGSLLANMLREGRRKDRGRDGTGPRLRPAQDSLKGKPNRCFADFAKIEQEQELGFSPLSFASEKASLLMNICCSAVLTSDMEPGLGGRTMSGVPLNCSHLG